jgi:imidazolonepropionase-like amidohydrolase
MDRKAGPIAIKSKLLLDGTGNAEIPNGIVIVEGAEIVQIGRPEEVSLPRDYAVIDCSGETVLPGLIEAHSHIQNCAANRFKRTAESADIRSQKPALLKQIHTYRNCLEDMASGVTTIRSLGSDDDSDIVLRDLIESGALIGPRILASGRPMRPSHGTARNLARIADGVEGVRKAVRESVVNGADVIKAFATNIQAGTGEAAYRQGDLTGVPAYTRAELEAICDEAHRAGLKAAFHAIGGPALRWAMEGGADSIEHANLMEEADIEVFLKTGCFLSDPNLYLFFDKEFGFESRPAWRDLPTWWREKVAAAREKTRTCHRKAYEAGVPFALALDSGHGLLWREAKCMVEVLGASPMDTILALTGNSARLCGLDNTGTLKAGNKADLISVRGNPLEDITDLQHVGLIMKEGRRCDKFLEFFLRAEQTAHDLLRKTEG